MSGIPKILITTGIVLIVFGALWTGLSKLGVGRLPGDFRIERENFSFYFPLASCLIISFLLTVFFNLFGKK